MSETKVQPIDDTAIMEPNIPMWCCLRWSRFVQILNGLTRILATAVPFCSKLIFFSFQKVVII